ncbi:DUF998 domain-containing protein [Reinekea blandensis]|uniref:DUF998 domain-containing protein n=1 Tax=Reinekea blandensis MED297 TaxID=314283 RepID=A4BJT9_9GAMM|nr:DUF998 domain-containing protein [Reinekea blandensis]EAR07606.1 hypothetical protein MED297_00275 [Reinekea sp. MED297] [Reinekea blandensis MED297]
MKFPVPKILSAVTIGLTLIGVAILTLIDEQRTIWHVVSRLNEVGAEHQSLASGLFLLIGVFWIGTLDQTRRWLEPQPFDGWLRFSAMAFAASYLLSMVFPCDEGCKPSGSLSQWLHLTLVWGLYFGPAVFAARALQQYSGLIRGLSIVVILFFAVLHVDLLFFDGRTSGVWQRAYEAVFCLLWWQVLSRLLRTPD